MSDKHQIAVMALGALLVSIGVGGLYGFWNGVMMLGALMIIGIPLYRS